MSATTHRVAAINAAAIAAFWPSWSPDLNAYNPHLLNLLAAIAAAAEMMAERERAPGFNWDNARHDWHAACAAIADEIARHPAPAALVFLHDLRDIVADSMEEADD